MTEWKKISEELPIAGRVDQAVYVLWWRKEWGNRTMDGIFSGNAALATQDRCAWLDRDGEYAPFPDGAAPTHWAYVNYPT